ncbi:MAG: putative aminophospholipid-translocase [Caeruleum heppii]|nr:MAG: putative aminophospholipid-translocase [Caeruleum heppii]
MLPSPPTPDTPSDGDESDLELETRELGPKSFRSVAGDRRPPSSQRAYGRDSGTAVYERQGPIALKNLRTGALRRSGAAANGRTRAWSELEGNSYPTSLEQDGDKRESQSSFHDVEDDVPLLRPQSPQGHHIATENRPPKKATLAGRLRDLTGSAKVSSPLATLESQMQVGTGTVSATSRCIAVGKQQNSYYPPNTISNAKYTPWSFLPVTLYNEFSFFFNLYFLLVALSQIIPPLRIGYLSTYIAPLAFVLVITLGKEAVDDIARRRRDAEANAEGYTVLVFSEDTRPTNLFQKKLKAASRRSNNVPTSQPRSRPTGDRLAEIQEEEEVIGSGEQPRLTGSSVSESIKKSRELKVGDVIKLEKDQRIPADVLILRSVSKDNGPTEEVVARSSTAQEQGPALLDVVSDPPLDANGPVKPSDDVSMHGSHSSSASDPSIAAETFIRTDQLDGETDWKLRVASPLTQSLPLGSFRRLQVQASRPSPNVGEFVGTIELQGKRAAKREPSTKKGKKAKNSVSDNEDVDTNPAAKGDEATKVASLSIDNTAWANTVLASTSTTYAVVLYTGPETRQALSTSPSRSKIGLLEYEINSLTKILCLLTLCLSIVLVALEGFESTDQRKWYVAMMRFLILFSTIIPISLRVNVDMGKSVYAWFIERDSDIKGAVVRTSTIPEELGRVEYLLSDKTGTLTQNEMELRKVHVGTVSYANEAMEEVSSYIRQAFPSSARSTDSSFPALVTPSTPYIASTNTTAATRTRREIGSRVRDLVLALTLCHNVTPTVDVEGGNTVTTYQASSPDEIAIVRWTESVGLRLLHRDRKSMILQSTHTGQVTVRIRILDIFPFTSESKRMGLVAQFYESDSDRIPRLEDGEIWVFQKGADTVMSSIVAANDWLDEETANMAREGLRTLVVGRKKLSLQQYKDFSSRYKHASLSLQDRDVDMARVIDEHLERDLELLGVTGVEDKLQRDVKPSLELLRNAGVKIWMLTGDKVETARCVAVSARLVARGQYVHIITKLKRKDLAQDSLDFLRSKPDACLLIDGESLSLFLLHFRDSFISLAVLLPAVIACRCSPTQKADIAKLIRAYTKKRICCIGDGGNDVSMIQAADVGVGIVGKEGRQASLAADFSIEQFCHLTKLLVWHGRNSYKRSAKLAQFIIHRGLIISVCQTMYSIASKFEPIALYKDWLLVGYATVYTMAPVFSLVLDKDVDEGLANLYPELYKELISGRSLSYRTFFVWVLVSIYQGSVIQGLSQILVEVDGPRMVAVSFTVLVINELIMVAFEITTWHLVMVLSLIGTALIYVGSIPFLGRYFDLAYVLTLGFVWRVAAISAISLIPPYAAKLVRRTLKPPSYRKVQGL